MLDRLHKILIDEGTDADIHITAGEITIVLHTTDKTIIERILWKWEHEVKHLN